MDDRVMGGLAMVGSVLVLLMYGFFLFFGEYGLLVIKVTAFAAVALILLMTAWIGYTLYTTPAPMSDFDLSEPEDGEAVE